MAGAKGVRFFVGQTERDRVDDLNAFTGGHADIPEALAAAGVGPAKLDNRASSSVVVDDGPSLSAYLATGTSHAVIARSILTPPVPVSPLITAAVGIDTPVIVPYDARVTGQSYGQAGFVAKNAPSADVQARGLFRFNVNDAGVPSVDLVNMPAGGFSGLKINAYQAMAAGYHLTGVTFAGSFVTEDMQTIGLQTSFKAAASFNDTPVFKRIFVSNQDTSDPTKAAIDLSAGQGDGAIIEQCHFRGRKTDISNELTEDTMAYAVNAQNRSGYNITGTLNGKITTKNSHSGTVARSYMERGRFISENDKALGHSDNVYYMKSTGTGVNTPVIAQGIQARIATPYDNASFGTLDNINFLYFPAFGHNPPSALTGLGNFDKSNRANVCISGYGQWQVRNLFRTFGSPKDFPHTGKLMGARFASAVFEATINGTTMTVTKMLAGTIQSGAEINGFGMPAGTTAVYLGGSGQTGTYTLSAAPGNVATAQEYSSAHLQANAMSHLLSKNGAFRDGYPEVSGKVGPFKSSLNEANPLSITNVASDTWLPWTIASGTYYYRVQFLADPIRKIGVAAAEISQAAVQQLVYGNGGAVVFRTSGGNVPACVMRVHRGTAAGSYNAYVDIPMPDGGWFIDMGDTLNGVPWIARAAAAMDTINTVDMGAWFEPGSVAPESDAYGLCRALSTVTAMPTVGSWRRGDEIEYVTPTGGKRGWKRITNTTLAAQSNVLTTDWLEMTF